MSTSVAILELPAVADAVERSADPAAARAGLVRVLEVRPGLADMLRDDELVREALVAVICASRSLTAALVSEPSLVDVLRDSSDEPLRAARDIRTYRESSAGALGADDERAPGAPALETTRVPAHRGARPSRAGRSSGGRGRARRSRRGLPRPRAGGRGAAGSVHHRRDGEARRARAQLRERRRRDVRPRPRASRPWRDGRCRRQRGGARGPRRHDGHDRAASRRHRVPHRRRSPARGTRRTTDAQPRQLRVLLRPLGPDLGVPGAHQGAAGRGRRRARTPVYGARATPRLARRARRRRASARSAP